MHLALTIAKNKFGNLISVLGRVTVEMNPNFGNLDGGAAVCSSVLLLCGVIC